MSLAFGISALFYFPWPTFLSFWPPGSLERRAQRRQVEERVQSAGGWEELRRQCIMFARTNENVQWIRSMNNASPVLPSAIRLLQPQRVDYLSPALSTSHPGFPQTPIVEIKIFGLHSTGGHSTPYFGLQVIAAAANSDYRPRPKRAAAGNGYGHYRMIHDGIFEVYE